MKALLSGLMVLLIIQSNASVNPQLLPELDAMNNQSLDTTFRQDSIVISYFQSGGIKTMSIYSHDSMKAIIEYWPNGNLKKHCIFFTTSNSFFNCAVCGDLYVAYDVPINDSVYFRGNQWYRNGAMKVITFPDPTSQGIVKYFYFSENGELLQKGQFVYRQEQELPCWERIGTWVWFDSGSSISQRKNY